MAAALSATVGKWPPGRNGLANGLPAGLMVYGPPDRDRYILRVAKGVEDALRVA